MTTEQLRADFKSQGFELRETHISLVFLGQSRVYKVKKPVSLGFLDFGTLAARKAACEAEIALNRRLAEGVYLGLRGIAKRGGQFVLLEGEGGEQAVEYAVEMVRLPDAASAEALLARGELTAERISALARKLAAFHAACMHDSETEQYGARAAIEGNVRENFEQTAESAPRHLEGHVLEQIKRYQLSFLQRNEHLFSRRVREGYVRDGHGDLRLEHVYFMDGEIEVIDCIEFNDRFRYADVAADLAFLCMDLSFHERKDLAEMLLSEYAQAANDYDLYKLIDFYSSYRAYVRAKVASLTEENEGLGPTERDAQHALARKYYLLAAAELKPPLQGPLMIVVFGRIASGKSTLSRRIRGALAAPAVSTDRTRKHLLDAAPDQNVASGAYEGAYSPDMTERVYGEVVRRAGTVLESLRPVVVDATCSRVAQRAQLLRLAEEQGVPVLFVECLVSDDECRRRLKSREGGGSVSDGRLSLLDDFMARYEAPDELPAALLTRVETDEIDDALVHAILSHPALGG